MRIPGSNLTCQFYYKHYCTGVKQHTVRFELNGVTQAYPVRTKTHATSIDQVPYWRIYIVKRCRVSTEYGDKYVREIIHKTVANYTFDDVCEFIREWGKPEYKSHKGCTYFYEAWPRKTRHNRKN